MMIQPNVHFPFRLSSMHELLEAARRLGVEINAQEDTSPLAQAVQLGGHVIPNSMCIQPMEGCDGRADGAPDELTFRRYERFAAGGAGLLWFEACAVVREGRANPRQLWLHDQTKGEFARLLERSRRAAEQSMGDAHRPLCVLQLTHSGRYSRPEREPRPIIAYHDPKLDADRGLAADYPLITDGEVEALEEAYVEAAKLAFEVGFDAVDVKACHRYLVNELLAARTREGNYGGSYENRTRFLRNVIARIKAAVSPDSIITCRLGVYDAHPQGWGTNAADPTKPDVEEPKRLIRELFELGLPMINITMGNPYFNPHVNRPYDRPVDGGAYPEEHPLVGVARLMGLTGEIQRALPEMAIVGSGYSWLRNLWPHVAAGNISAGAMRVVGVGRQALAYPGFAKEIIETGRLDRRHTCITCSGCTQIMRDGGRTGCVPFDREVYGPIYRQGRRSSPEYVKAQAERCRDCFNATCREGCPAGVDIPGFIRALAEGDVTRSYQILRESNALPELCAHVCPSDVLCEAECVEGTFSGIPVPIRALQLAACRTARGRGHARIGPSAPRSGRRVAVIGAGAAGLACAARLLSLGHSVDLFDLRESFGGIAESAIPGKRLPGDSLRVEVEEVLAGLESSGLAIHWGKGLTHETDLDYFASHYDAVFVGVGLGAAEELWDSRPEGVLDAVTFLESARCGESTVPDRVAVLGGGNTAMDAATTAARLGAHDVYLVYRRSFREMPAWPTERDEALAMGVHFLVLTQAIGCRADEHNRVSGIQISRTIPGQPDASGRRSPKGLEGSECILDVDMVIEAHGQVLPTDFEHVIPGVELTDDRLVKIDECGRSTRPGVFAGGDVTNGGTTAVQAVAEGMRAAEAIDDYLRDRAPQGR